MFLLQYSLHFFFFFTNPFYFLHAIFLNKKVFIIFLKKLPLTLIFNSLIKIKYKKNVKNIN